MTRKGRSSAAATVAGAIAVAVVLALVLADRRDEFAEALHAAPLWVLLLAAALQVLALLTRCEAWRTCVVAAGATISRRRLFRAGGLGNLGSLVNAQPAAAAKDRTCCAAWRPDETPQHPALIAADIPIITIEAVLAALSSFTLVGPLGLPWWTPVILVAVMLGVVAPAAAPGRSRPRILEGARGRCAASTGRTRVIALGADRGVRAGRPQLARAACARRRRLRVRRDRGADRDGRAGAAADRARASARRPWWSSSAATASR